MINIKELNGKTIKKYLGCNSASFRWHNKNKSGGNFGFNIYYAKEFNRDTDREITGYYNKEGNIYALRFGYLYQCGHNVPIWALKDLETLFNDYLKVFIGWEKGLNASPKCQESELLSKKEQLRQIGFNIPEEVV